LADISGSSGADWVAIERALVVGDGWAVFAANAGVLLGVTLKVEVESHALGNGVAVGSAEVSVVRLEGVNTQITDLLGGTLTLLEDDGVATGSVGRPSSVLILRVSQEGLGGIWSGGRSITKER
jgi:hypothetical protein